MASYYHGIISVCLCCITMIIYIQICIHFSWRARIIDGKVAKLCKIFSSMIQRFSILGLMVVNFCVKMMSHAPWTILTQFQLHEFWYCQFGICSYVHVSFSGHMTPWTEIWAMDATPGHKISPTRFVCLAPGMMGASFHPLLFIPWCSLQSGTEWIGIHQSTWPFLIAPQSSLHAPSQNKAFYWISLCNKLFSYSSTAVLSSYIEFSSNCVSENTPNFYY